MRTSQERMEARERINVDRDRPQTEHEWDLKNGDDRDRPQMADDEENDSQALTGGDIMRYRALVPRISYLSQDRPDLKFASMQVCCAMAKPYSARHGTRQEDRTITSLGSRWQGAGSRCAAEW